MSKNEVNHPRFSTYEQAKAFYQEYPNLTTAQITITPYIQIGNTGTPLANPLYELAQYEVQITDGHMKFVDLKAAPHCEFCKVQTDEKDLIEIQREGNPFKVKICGICADMLASTL